MAQGSLRTQLAATGDWLLRVLLVGAMLGGLLGAATGTAEARERQAAEAPANLAEARNVRFNHLLVEDGLSHAAVMAITQDTRGYIWFGTQDGLNRYDGRHLVTYLRDPADSKQLPHNWIWALHSDRRGHLWVGTDGGGLARLDLTSGEFTTYRSEGAGASGLGSDRIRALFEDRNGILWIGTDGGGLSRYDHVQDRFRTYRHDPQDPHSLPHDSVLAILEDSNGILWIGTNGGGLARLDRTNERFHSYQHSPQDPTSLSDDRVRTLLEDKEGVLWIGTYEGGLNRLAVDTGRFERFLPSEAEIHGLASKRVRSLFEDRRGTLWVGTEDGLFTWVPASRRFVRYVHDLTDPSSLSDDRVTTIFQDAGGVLWIGTFGGVNAWNYLSDAFEYLVAADDAAKGLGGTIVTSIAKAQDGDLWVGTYDGGLTRVDAATRRFETYRHDPRDENSLPDNRVMTVLPEKDGVWVGTRNGGLARLDLRTDNFVRYQEESDQPGSLSSNRISALRLDPDGTLWIGTYGGGLNRRDPVSGKFEVYRHDPADETTISSDRILDIYRDRSGKLWIGTENGGLNRFDEAKGRFVHYRHDPNDNATIGSDTAWRIIEDQTGSLWIGTLDGGLNQLEWIDQVRDRYLFRRVTRKDGLLSDTIYGLLRDDDDTLWLSSARGLTRYNPITGAMRHFDRHSGLRSDEFNFAAQFQDSSGKLYFGGPSGLVGFYPQRLIENAHKPPVVVTVSAGGEPIATGHSDDAQPTTATLDFRDRRVTFEFAALDFASPDKNAYRYRLEGFDEAWREGGEFPRATYTNLPPGPYRFEVSAANNDGIWSDQSARILLHVPPAPWHSTPAYVAYGSIGCALLLAFWRHQRRKVRRTAEQKRELERQVKDRTQELMEANEELARVNGRLVEASVTDSLTGLKNRRFLDTIIEEKVESVDRRCHEHKVPAASAIGLDITPRLFFMMIDLDGFKAINDSYGHHAGDQALLQVSAILKSCCRPLDVLIRWGGDEFLIVGESGADRAVEKLAESIRVRLSETQFQLGGGHVGRLSGSIGFAFYPYAPLDPELMAWEKVATLADHAAYVAKENGRNAWVGLYGKSKASREELEQIKGDIPILLGKGYLELRTSITGELVLNRDYLQQQAQ